MGITSKGVALGLATLDANGRIASANTAQAAVVADQAALTAAAPAAITAAAPGAITGANAVGGTPTAGEHNALVVDVTAIRAEVVKLVTDLTATRAEVVKAVTDLGVARTKLNAELAALRLAGLQAT